MNTIYLITKTAQTFTVPSYGQHSCSLCMLYFIPSLQLLTVHAYRHYSCSLCLHTVNTAAYCHHCFSPVPSYAHHSCSPDACIVYGHHQDFLFQEWQNLIIYYFAVLVAFRNLTGVCNMTYVFICNYCLKLLIQHQEEINHQANRIMIIPSVPKENRAISPEIHMNVVPKSCINIKLKLYVQST